MTFTNRGMGTEYPKISKDTRYPKIPFVAFHEFLAFIGGHNRYRERLFTKPIGRPLEHQPDGLQPCAAQLHTMVGLHQHEKPREGATIALVAHTCLDMRSYEIE